MIDYNNYVYITPPRTESKIPPALLSAFERRGYIAQPKLNGTHSLVFVPPDRNIFARGRHGDSPHKTWDFTEAPAQSFMLPGSKWFVFDCELLHHKVPGFRNIHYIFDVLVYEGKHLTGTTYADRYKLLKELWVNSLNEIPYEKIDEYTWLAPIINENFHEQYNELIKCPEIEGLMLKDPKGTYRTHHAGWMARCRRPHKNYGF